MNQFDAVWQAILNNLKNITIIRNWTALKGYLGDTIKVVSVEEFKVVIESPKAKHQIHIPRDDFEKVWNLWTAYKNGQAQRQEIRDITFYSKYIISIFHWLELQRIIGSEP